MNDIERRALYYLLRINWLSEPNMPVEPWQIEDYKAKPIQELFDRLKSFQITLDRTSFIAYADECDSPEDLTDHLVADSTLQNQDEDQIYLLIFELWRRLMSEKPSLSVMCNELDEQIYLYDNQQLENPFALQDALSHFKYILDQNVDEGVPPESALQLISTYCANDIEAFLYDFISEQIDEDNETYAMELLDDFDSYLGQNKWFKLLRIRLSGKTLSKMAQKLTQEVVEEHLTDEDIDFHLEFLSLLAEKGDHTTFKHVYACTFPLVKREEEFQDLLTITIDYFQRLDQEKQENALRNMLEQRKNLPLDQAFETADSTVKTLNTLFESQISY